MLILLAVLAGVALTVQVALNSQLRAMVGHPIVATLGSFLVGTFVTTTYLLATRTPLPAASRLATVPWWAWAGGALGAAYVLSTIVLAPRLGPGTLLGAIVLGQMTGAILVEHHGWLGMPVHGANWVRVVGVGLIVVGVVLVRRF